MQVKISRFISLFLGLIGVALLLLTTSSAIAGDACVNCHTMHHSQDGAAIGSGPYGQLLLNNTCLGCHTGTNNGTTLKHYVLDSADPANTQLAGGNFYWTELAVAETTRDPKAHNVTGLSVNAQDNALADTPPGGSALSGNITCAGTTGCHGNRTNANEFTDLGGAHHNNETAQITVAEAQAAATANEPGQAYRFLDGIAGYEHVNREYEATQTATTGHNEYYGDVRANDSLADSNTISALCAVCHADFHNDSGGEALGSGGSNFASPWLRHPTDLQMAGLGGEYAGYSSYSLLAPVARSTVPAAASSTVNTTAGTDAIVMCLSCHKAHGSAYADILRWDYDAATTQCVSEIGNGSGTQCGCFECHTTKDD